MGREEPPRVVVGNLLHVPEVGFAPGLGVLVAALADFHLGYSMDRAFQGLPGLAQEGESQPLYGLLPFFQTQQAHAIKRILFAICFLACD